MLRHLGYRGEAPEPLGALAERGLREHSIVSSPELIRQKIRENLHELARVLRSNHDHGLMFYRVSSQIIPFASHPEKTIPWWDEFAGELARIGYFVRRHGLRLEMHPGQYLLLNSPSPETVALSILELGWHVRLFDALQLDASHKLVLRVGAKFGDRTQALNRFACLVNGLPQQWKNRLVIENHQSHYGLAEVLEASAMTGLPVAVGCPAQSTTCGEALELSKLIQLSFQTWNLKDGAPIIHLGQNQISPNGSDFSRAEIGVRDLELIQMQTPEDLAYDCLLEIRHGDRTILEIQEQLSSLHSMAMPGQVKAN